MIENVGLTGDMYDAIDLSDNEITILTNFPRLERLRMLLLNNNPIARVDEHFATYVPVLDTLIMTNNRINSFVDLDNICRIQNLEILSLAGNPIQRKANYRLFVISRLPKLKMLDFVRIREKERIDSMKFALSRRGKAFYKELHDLRAGKVPQESPPAGTDTSGALQKSAQATTSGTLDPAIAARLHEIINKAQDPQVISRIEQALLSGTIEATLDEIEKSMEQ